MAFLSDAPQDLSNNELSGALPSLPPNMRLLNLSANALDGGFPGAGHLVGCWV